MDISRELVDYLRSAPRDSVLLAGLQSVCQRIGEELAGKIRAAAPVGETDHLQQSVRVESLAPSSTRVGVVVLAGGALTTKPVKRGAPYDYALGEEFGNHHEPARPFFFSTFYANEDDLNEQFEGYLARELADHWLLVSPGLYTNPYAAAPTSDDEEFQLKLPVPGLSFAVEAIEDMFIGL